MTSGFFPEGSFQKEKQFSTASRCGACGIYKHCHHPKMAPQGEGDEKIMFVLPPVTEEEDQTGKFLNSKLGDELKSILRRNNVSPAGDCYFTAATICHTNQPSNEQIDHCSYKLKSSIEELKPAIIIPIGPAAIRSIIQFTWKRSAGLHERWCGYQIPAQTINAWVCPTYQPSFEDRDISLLFTTRHIEAALSLPRKPPWKKVPDYSKKVKMLYTEDELYDAVSKWFDVPFVAGFDYETTCLKPDNPKTARIVSGALCFYGKETYAFPWLPNAPAILKRLARNKHGWFIGSNLKYEERWSKSLLGFFIRRWLWDTMLSAHAIDNRGGKDEDTDSSGGGGLSSVKFQAFVRLGQPIYDDHIKQFLVGEGSYGANRIKEIPLESLLRYNGLDALLSYLVAKDQMKQMDHPSLEYML
jgi:uracil-DNA glycosylase family 4